MLPLGGGRGRTSAGCRRYRPVHRESFWWELAGLRPASSHQKQFSPGAESFNTGLAGKVPIGRGRDRATVGRPRSRPGHRRSFVRGLHPTTTHTKPSLRPEALFPLERRVTWEPWAITHPPAFVKLSHFLLSLGSIALISRNNSVPPRGGRVRSLNPSIVTQGSLCTWPRPLILVIISNRSGPPLPFIVHRDSFWVVGGRTKPVHPPKTTLQKREP